MNFTTPAPQTSQTEPPGAALANRELQALQQARGSVAGMGLCACCVFVFVFCLRLFFGQCAVEGDEV